jgi:hypothetical protein
MLFGPQETLLTLDPSSKTPVLTVYAINYNRLKLRAYQVQPGDWLAFASYLNEYYRQGDSAEPPGNQVMDETVRVEAAADELTEVSIDLSPALDGSTGQLIVIVEPEDVKDEDRYWRMVRVWVQVTQIGLDAFADHSEMVVWTTALQDGSPLAGLSIEDDAGEQVATTGDEGTARFKLPGGGTTFLVARQGDDYAFLPESPYPWAEDAWRPVPVRDELRWYVFDDRAMYRPGEEVHVKGWLRKIGGKQDGDVGLVGELHRSRPAGQ